MAAAEFVVLGNRAWGRGPTVKQAKAAFRAAGGQLARGYVVLQFDGVTSTFVGVHPVDGQVSYRGEAPAVVARRDPTQS